MAILIILPKSFPKRHSFLCPSFLFYFKARLMTQYLDHSLTLLRLHASSRKLEGIQRMNSRSTYHFIEEKAEHRDVSGRILSSHSSHPMLCPPKGELPITSCPPDCPIFACHHSPLGALGLKQVTFDSPFSAGSLFHLW